MPVGLTSDRPEFAARQRELLRSVPGGVHCVVLLLRDHVATIANAVAKALGPDAVIHVLCAQPAIDDATNLDPRVRLVPAESLQARLDYLKRVDRPQAIIDAGDLRRAHKTSSFRQLFFFVIPGGFYAIEDLAACGDPEFDDGAGETVVSLLTKVAATSSVAKAAADKSRGYVRRLASQVGRIEFSDGHAVVERRGDRLHVKLRDWESDDVLTARYGTRWGSVVERRAAAEFLSRSEVTSHGDGPIPSGRKLFAVPDRTLRRYTDAICSGRQIVRFGDYLLPDSFRHPHQPTLGNRYLVNVSPYFGTYVPQWRPTETLHLEGAYYYLDTELPGHFGHVSTEVLSRVWAWEVAREADPSVRLLLSANRLPGTIPKYQQTMLRSLGLRIKDAVVIGPRQAAEVERLYSPTPQLENPHYVDPDITQVWARLGAGLPAGRPSKSEKIFISRRPSDKRHCRQTPEVETFFAHHGFEIVFPEDHPYEDQKMIFAGARVIAGFGGSGIFNAMFAPRAKLIVISGDSYNAENEHLIAAANGSELHYFWGRSDVPMPPGKFSLEAFTSSFDFDLRRHRRVLRRLIR